MTISYNQFKFVFMVTHSEDLTQELVTRGDGSIGLTKEVVLALIGLVPSL